MSTALTQQSQPLTSNCLYLFYSAAVAFLAYASVYAYRKPFTVATFDGMKFWGVSYQTLLIISQVIGYMLSKFYGIKFISELKRFGRWKTILLLMSIAWGALFCFAITPAPYGVIFLFINGFPLGFLWGIVFSYVEDEEQLISLIGIGNKLYFFRRFSRSVAKWLMVDWVYLKMDALHDRAALCITISIVCIFIGENTAT